ncbi:MAG: molybdopterin-dependent oxidoreductase, partial [Rhizobiaceae bacterium]|nr:molybdopterin-dependent oxidoreductase [Rhizobiaceae bacterium]
MANPKRVSHCSHWGSYTLLVDDGRIVGVEPFDQDPNPSPIIQNVTGWADPSKRVLKPMVRREWLEKRGHLDGGGRGRDTFVEVSWETAFDLVASEINRVRHEHGNASIFAGSYGWTSCGRFHHASSQLKRMLNLVGGFTGHVDTYSIAAGPVILRHVLGDSAACDGGANTLDTIAEHTDTLVVFGALSPRTAQNEAGGLARHQLEDYLKQMRDRGMRIVLVSPLRDDLPDWLPAEWWPIRP